MKRNEHWPYGTIEEIKRVAEKDWRNTKTVLAIMVTVILSGWLGLMFAQGL